jgi:enterochelin esterase-like enzyme
VKSRLRVRRLLVRALASGLVLPTTPRRSIAAEAARASTALPGVRVLPPIALPGLGRERTLRLWVPAGQDAPGASPAPVIVAHDAQNLFDAATSFAGEWAFDELMAEREGRLGFRAVVVGIDHGGERRVTELNPFDHERFGRGEGGAYVAAILEAVLPWVAARFAIRRDAGSTAIVGSSLGALVSLWAAHRHPQVFGRVGALSPALWIAPGLADFVAAHPLPPSARVAITAGGEESASMLPLARALHAQLAARGSAGPAVTLTIDAHGRHDEAAWRRALPGVLASLFDTR